MSLQLHAFPHSPRGFKVLAAANHLGLDYEFHLVDLGKGDQRRPEFLALNPNGRMPVLEDDGFVLWESNAILQYLADKRPEAGMLPMDARGPPTSPAECSGTRRVGIPLARSSFSSVS